MQSYVIKNAVVPLNDSWDVIVVGGGPAGCAAATAAAREGAKTLLVEANGALGGMGTLGLVPWFCGYADGERIIARGIAEHILQACRDSTPHLKKNMEANPLCPPAIDPELLKRIYDEMVTQAGAEVLFNTQLCSVEMADDQHVDAILVSNKAGLTAYRAKIYVDCTGDGDLAAWAGCEYEKGDQEGAMQPATHCFAITNIDEYGLSTGPRVHFYDPDSPVHKAIKSEKYPLIKELHSCSMQIGPGTYGFNTGHLYDVNNTDPASVSQALMHGRQMAHQYMQAFKEFHPAFANAFLTATGAMLGARETRRIIGDYVLTADDYLARRSFDDEICRNAYNIDVHGSSKKNAQDTAKKDIQQVKESITKQIKQYQPGESFGVPYRCLTPAKMENILVAGRCISSDRPVNGSVRIMACCLTTGEAAGTAASLAASDSQNVHQIDCKTLRQILINHGAYLP